MDESLLEIRSHEGEGYKPLVDFGSWRVAVYRTPNGPDSGSLQRMERHLETDEVFVLTKGEGTLVLGGNGHELGPLARKKMDIGTIYNVKRCTWHTVVLNREASLLIVENRDTGDHNSEQVMLLAEQKQILLELAAQMKQRPGL